MKVITVRHMALVEAPPSSLLSSFFYTYQDDYTSKEIKAYMEEGNNRFWIPRYMFIDKLEDASWEKADIEFVGELRDYQKQIVNKFLSDPFKNGIIQAGTGSGKTVMALYIASQLKLRTLIVVPREILIDQWVDRIKKFTNVRNVGVIQGSVFHIDAPIVVAMLQTLVLSSRMKQRRHILYKHFGTTIYDEVHLLGAEKFSEVATLFWDKYRLGLSATPDRKDKMQHLFFNHIGPVKAVYQATPSVPVVYKVLLDTKINDSYFQRGEKFGFAEYVTYLSKNEHRTGQILYLVKTILDKQPNRKILILTDRVEHANTIYKLLSYIYDGKCGLVTGQEKTIDRDVLIGTYGACGLGFDKDDLDTLIFATPRGDIRQALGRVTRRTDVKPVVFDLVDINSEVAKALFYKRLSQYNKLRCVIKNLDLRGKP